MILKIIEKKLTRDKKRSKKFILASALVLKRLWKFKYFSQPLLVSDLNKNANYLNKSFITKAVERTGSSVVTIETEICKTKNFPNDSRIFIDPYFERFWIKIT